MSKFRFAVNSRQMRQEGVIQSDSFGEAIDNLWEHVEVQQGDTLEIGVKGFPPAFFHCVGALNGGRPVWMPAKQLAA
jgi:hypothetical protein